MPITASYTWTEKKDTIKVMVPLKGVSASKADVLVSVSTLKVNFSPYILDIVLFKEVDSVKHKATVKDGVLSITLCKKEPGLWGAIEIDGSKEEIKAAKLDASAQQALLNETLSQQRQDRKLAEEKHSLRKQMKLEEMERTRVENLKQEEKESAEKEVYEAFAQMHLKENKTDGNIKPSVSYAAAKKAVTFGSDGAASLPVPPPASHAPSSSNIDSFLAADDIDEVPRGDAKQSKYNMEEIDESHDDEWEKVASPVPSAKTDIFEDSQHYVEEEEEEVRYVPPPRSSGLSSNADQKIGISFTPRVFPTPMRESKAAEEEDWVAKNRRHIKNHGVLGKNQGADVSEEDPVWLKAKGDDFFRSGDMRSALNAYAAALDADPKMLPCLANRSVCHLRLSQPAECMADCTTAMQIIAAEVEGGDTKNAGMVVKLLMRRGTASCQLGLFTDALTDYHQARVRYEQLSGAQIGHLNGVSVESLAADIVRLKLLSDAETLKKEGDALMAERDTTGALAKYTAALALIPVHVSCLSNRSACRLAMRDLDGCIGDCSTAVAILSTDATPGAAAAPPAEKGLDIGTGRSVVLQQEQLKTMLATILPPAGSTKRVTWLVKTLLRRGVAYTQQGKYDLAVEDYTAASVLDPANEALKGDLQQLIAARDKETIVSTSEEAPATAQ